MVVRWVYEKITCYFYVDYAFAYHYQLLNDFGKQDNNITWAGITIIPENKNRYKETVFEKILVKLKKL